MADICAFLENNGKISSYFNFNIYVLFIKEEKQFWLDLCKKWTGYKKECYRYKKLSVRSFFSKICEE